MNETLLNHWKSKWLSKYFLSVIRNSLIPNSRYK